MNGPGGPDDPWWAVSDAALARRLAPGPGHPPSPRAGSRGLMTPARMPAWRLAARQLENPIVVLLVAATAMSMLLGEVGDGVIILVITLASALLGYVQERGAVRAVEELLATVRVRVRVVRGGDEMETSLDGVEVGDVLCLAAGDVVAADARVLTSNALQLDESSLTGESFPVEKRPGIVPEQAELQQRTNCVWCGTHVVSGTGTALVVNVRADTEFGKIGNRLGQAHVPTAFELGLRRFGLLLMRTAAVLVTVVFVVNVSLHRPVVEALLFSLALAVGLTPQLLPAIVTVTLAKGARQLAERKVVVKRLDAIEDIGAMNVLCTDKTGTLTVGAVRLDQALDRDAEPSASVRRLAWTNASAVQDAANPIDAAVIAYGVGPDPPRQRVVAVLPYDFDRRMVSVLVENDDGSMTLITKGAVLPVLQRCASGDMDRAALDARFAELSRGGARVLAVATRSFDRTHARSLGADDECGLGFAGFLCFGDPPKDGAAAAIRDLAALGVRTTMITGDNRHAAEAIARTMFPGACVLLTGDEVEAADDDALDGRVDGTDVFAEITPLQKERIVASLRRRGNVVGFLGDGINDAPALRVADVGISVDAAVGVAKHTASVVLLEKDLRVISEGIRHGRRMFANTIKYVQVTISANFGNMVSMAAAAVVLPFLPLLPRQILLLNLLSDIPAMAIAADRVDPESVSDPHGWELGRLRSFMIVFGLISSAFDLATFAMLRFGFDAGQPLFHTGWFIESTATELAVMLVLRTRERPWRSRPGTALAFSSLAVAIATVLLPFSPLSGRLGLVAPHLALLVALAAVITLYVIVTELAKQRMTAAIDSARPAARTGTRAP